MKTNVGSIDRTLRVVLGLALLSLLFTVDGALRWIGLVGLIPLATAGAGWCPAYALLGISSCPLDSGARRA
ncbi:MAG TPA: DUF2892 domain-containing protein [Stellaceae bacterium]